MKIIVILFAFLSIGTTTNSGIVDKAIAIQKQYKVTNDKYVVMVDYSKSINEERLYVVNTKTAQIEITSIVSHGKNSGKQYATDFSNVMESNKSSLGAYLTENTYYGHYGYSLVLKGLDKTNSNAKKRKIIFHSSKIMQTKWSFGCFSLPEKNTKKIIDMIKGGCLVYAYN
jgi:hypothetical protein